MLRKKDSKKIALDLRTLNSRTVRRQWPLPTSQEIFDSIDKAKYITVCDVASAYFSVPLSEESRKYTAFNTPIGQYEWCRVPYGAVNAPSDQAQFMDMKQSLEEINLLKQNIQTILIAFAISQELFQ